jgi:CHAT domain
LQTDDLQLRQLPFQLWNFLDRFPHAEITIASNIYQSIVKQQLEPEKMTVLAIFGSSEGINLALDRDYLSTLTNARVDFLVEPSRQILNDKLWEQPWDIMFFAGHSASNASLTTGHLKINATDRLTIPELKYALQRSIESGLKLVIINSCDGLGLATELISIQVPQTIVMREFVPDVVAQQFLKNFLIAFISGLPLYRSVRQAREQLQGLEDKYPCASWLPVVCQNPAAIIC